MKTVFKKSEVNFGSYAEAKGLDKYLAKENFTIDDLLNAEVSLKDKAWFITKNCEFSDMELRQLAIGCALCVLPIYESKYPNNRAPREAIEAAQAYLTGATNNREDLYIKRKNAGVAFAAAHNAAVHTVGSANCYASDTTYAAHTPAYAAGVAFAAATAGYASHANYFGDGYDYAPLGAARTAVYAGSDCQKKLLHFFKDFINEADEIYF